LSATALVAIDWGTSAARAYCVDANGGVLDRRSVPLGVRHVREGRFETALATLLGDWSVKSAPRVACGMIGSRQGWVEAPYVDCPASLTALSDRLVRAPLDALAIVPGVTTRDVAGTPDVMRGEETQLLGAVAHDEPGVLAVLPGTHSKWAIIGAAGIEAFSTFMTGELYGVLFEHSILGRLAAPGSDAEAFTRGVRHSLRSNAALSHDLFSARTLALTDRLAPSGVGDYLSGLLLGAEITAARGWLASRRVAAGRVTLVGAQALVDKYRTALAIAGIDADVGAEDAAARGLWRIARHAGMLR